MRIAFPSAHAIKFAEKSPLVVSRILRFFFLWIALVPSVQGAIPPSERTVLDALYTSTNGLKWLNNAGWNGAPGTECSWKGITCNASGSNVVGISLGQNWLTGSLPSLDGLAALQSFDVAQNYNLSGPLPSLSNLKALQHFYAGINNFTGPIPSLDGLTELQTFWVVSNRLTGPIPPLGNQRWLQVFNVGNNQLTGPIPPITGLTALALFNAQYNQLTGSIPPLAGLTALQEFVVFNNGLTGTIPSLSGLTTLQRFDVSGNKLTGGIPSLTSLPALKYFNLESNQLTGTIPSLSGLTALVQFWVDFNQLSGPVPAPPASLPPYQSRLCGNNFISSGDPAIDAAWKTATNGNWIVCQPGIVVEFYNTTLDHYFYAADPAEATAIDNGSAGPGWNRTGYTFKSGGRAQTCRFYGSLSPGPNSHFFTAIYLECASLRQIQAATPATEKRWNFEGNDFMTEVPTDGTCTTGTVPVYRAYNNGFTRNIDSNHRITSSLTAIQEVVNRGWKNEGVVMCAPQ